MSRRGGLIGLVGKGVGVASEYREHRKQQKLSRENSQQDEAVIAESSTEVRSASQPNPPTYVDAASEKKAAQAQYDEKTLDDDDDLSSIEDDEEDWELDEALDRGDSNEDLPTYDESEREYVAVDTLVNDVMSKNRAAASPSSTLVRAPLPCPVIIPQRRPRKKVRGFVRAYAPLLGECSGIDQATFLAFLKNFYESSKASPVFPVIQVAAAIAGFAPSVIAMAVTTVVQIAAATGEEIQARHRTNDFLDKINEELFKPAGLFAMIVKYKTTSEVQQSSNSIFARFGISGEIVDLNTTQSVAKYNRDESSGSGGMSDRLKNIRLASGKTAGAVRLPESAPLIFPDVDAALAKDGPETFKDKSKDAKLFLQDYMDRRAQMTYVSLLFKV